MLLDAGRTRRRGNDAGVLVPQRGGVLGLLLRAGASWSRRAERRLRGPGPRQRRRLEDDDLVLVSYLFPI